jgi:MFS family permease
MVVVDVLFRVSTALFFPAIMALRADIIPRDIRGRVMGLMGTLRSLVIVPAATVFGYLYEVNRAYPYMIGVFIEVVTVTLIWGLISEPESFEE